MNEKVAAPIITIEARTEMCELAPSDPTKCGPMSTQR